MISLRQTRIETRMIVSGEPTAPLGETHPATVRNYLELALKGSAALWLGIVYECSTPFVRLDDI